MTTETASADIGARDTEPTSGPLGLVRQADLRTLAFVSVYFMGTAAAFVFHPDNIWARIPIVVGLAWMSFTCAVITHNTIHVPIFHSHTRNRIFQGFLSLAYGHPVSAFVPGHNLSHHRHVQSARDVMRTTKLRFRWNLLNQLLHPLMVSRAITGGEMAFAKAMRKYAPDWFRQFVLEWVFLGLVVVSLLILNWKAAILYVMIPHAVAAQGIIGINFAQHDGCDEKDPYNHSRNFMGAIENWLLFNNGYHSAHHHNPGTHWSELPEAHEKEFGGRIHPNLEQPSLPGYLFKALVWPGKRLRYDGTPLVLDEPMEDEEWIPDPAEVAGLVSYGAIRMDKLPKTADV